MIQSQPSDAGLRLNSLFSPCCRIRKGYAVVTDVQPIQRPVVRQTFGYQLIRLQLADLAGDGPRVLIMNNLHYTNAGS